MTSTHCQLKPAAENAFIVYFEQRIDSSISAMVQQACNLIRTTLKNIIIDLVPSYASILVVFDPQQAQPLYVEHALWQCLRQLQPIAAASGKRIELPVYYNEESGPDLRTIANAKDTTVEEVIRRHQAVCYRVYAIGFAPGFAYLGEVDPILEMPRLSTPRARVPKGSVAIADRQTAVYPATSPGGWHLIGLCPVTMFNPAASPAMPVQVGDEVQFCAISKTEFLQLGGQL